MPQICFATTLYFLDDGVKELEFALVDVQTTSGGILNLHRETEIQCIS